MNKNNYVIKTKKYDCVDYAQIETTHKFIEKFIRYILCIYEYKNYGADMKLNVLDGRTDERVVTSALCYVEHGKIVCFGLHFCLFPSATIALNVTWLERKLNAYK